MSVDLGVVALRAFLIIKERGPEEEAAPPRARGWDRSRPDPSVDPVGGGGVVRTHRAVPGHPEPPLPSSLGAGLLSLADK